MRIWSDAVELARRTPPERNRYADFLRALAILVVVFGHWLVSAPRVTDTGLTVTSMLGVAAWTLFFAWLTSRRRAQVQLEHQASGLRQACHARAAQ